MKKTTIKKDPGTGIYAARCIELIAMAIAWSSTPEGFVNYFNESAQPIPQANQLRFTDSYQARLNEEGAGIYKRTPADPDWVLHYQITP